MKTRCSKTKTKSPINTLKSRLRELNLRYTMANLYKKSDNLSVMHVYGTREDYYGPDNPSDYIDPSKVLGAASTMVFPLDQSPSSEQWHGNFSIQAPGFSQAWIHEKCYGAQGSDERKGAKWQTEGHEGAWDSEGNSE